MENEKNENSDLELMYQFPMAHKEYVIFPNDIQRILSNENRGPVLISPA
jgi:hypothetical protein